MTMMNNNWQKLKSRTFPEILTEANLQYLNDRIEHPEKYLKGDEFCPMNTANRNPEQVPNGTWVKLLHKHIQHFFYN
jgi:hypothetical protein